MGGGQSLRKNILISEPNAEQQILYLPYVWAVLKSYYERHGRHPNSYRWFDPIYRIRTSEELLAPYGDERIDVLGLSCYVWNWEVQREIGERVRERHPDCLIVVGGPDPDYSDPDFFEKHPFVDVVVVKDGEIPFCRILDELAEGSHDFRSIPGLRLKSESGRATLPVLSGAREVQLTGEPEVPRVFDHSPYRDQDEYYQRIVAEHGEGRFCVIWETSRGCPYSCSFCDWGSSTHSKVRAFEMERVAADLAWICRARPVHVFLVDANFGILPRDVEVAAMTKRMVEEHGYPKNLYFSPAKNNPERTIDVAKSFLEAGILETFPLAIQHTNKHVLACTDRANISPDKQREVVKTAFQTGTSIEVQLILGIPGDTVALWKECLAELMEWGIHDNFLIHSYSLLPNAPAAAASFRRKWGIQTVQRFSISTTGSLRKRGTLDGLFKTPVIVGCRTYTPEDWCTMHAYSGWIKALHNRSLTRLLALYLRYSQDVTFLEFYGSVVDDFCAKDPLVGDWHRELLAMYHRFLEDESAVEDCALTELDFIPYNFEPSQWLFLKVILHFEEFWDRLGPFLRERFGFSECLDSVLDFQKEMTILPSYDYRAGKSFVMHHDWPAYFRRAMRLTSFRRLDDPSCTPGEVVEVHRTTLDDTRGAMLDWAGRSSEDFWNTYVDRMVLRRVACSRNLFQLSDLTRPLLAESTP